MKIDEDYNAKEQIMAKVQWESDYEWARKPSYHSIPKFTKPPKPKRNVVGWIVFFKEVFKSNAKQLMP